MKIIFRIKRPSLLTALIAGIAGLLLGFSLGFVQYFPEYCPRAFPVNLNIVLESIFGVAAVSGLIIGFPAIILSFGSAGERPSAKKARIWVRNAIIINTAIREVSYIATAMLGYFVLRIISNVG